MDYLKFKYITEGSMIDLYLVGFLLIERKEWKRNIELQQREDKV